MVCYGMLCYGMLCYALVWLLWYGIYDCYGMICSAMVATGPGVKVDGPWAEGGGGATTQCSRSLGRADFDQIPWPSENQRQSQKQDDWCIRLPTQVCPYPGPPPTPP